MEKFYLGPTPMTPEIHFSADENIFIIRGISSPDDVRSFYFPAIEWLKTFTDSIIEKDGNIYTSDNPLKLQVNLEYFNSSSAKFLYDIFLEFNRLSKSNIPVIIEWYYDEEDIDMLEAGTDIALLAEMEFVYIQNNK